MAKPTGGALQELYFIVYAETEASLKKMQLGGGSDQGLTAQGIEAAQVAAKRLKKNPFKIKRMIAGPELRCVQMADICHDEMKAKITLRPNFADQRLGELEGSPLAKGQTNFEIVTAGPGIEDPRAFQTRVSEGVKKILEEKELTLLIAHPRVARAILLEAGLEGEKIEPLQFYHFTIYPPSLVNYSK